MTAPPRAAAEIQKRTLSFLVLAHLANDSYFGLLPPILPLLLVRYGWPVAFAGILTTSLSFAGALGQPILVFSPTGSGRDGSSRSARWGWP